MNTLTRATLSLAILLTAGTANVALGIVAVFTPTADANMGSLPYYQYNNEGGLYWSMVGEMGNFSGVGMDQRTLMRFDVSSLGGLSNLQVSSITLRIFSAGNNYWFSGAAVTPQIYAVSAANRDWVEGTGDPNAGGDGLIPINGTCCWAAKSLYVDPSGNPQISDPRTHLWAGGSGGLTVAGADYDATMLATRSFLPLDTATAGVPYDFTFSGGSTRLTGLINTWLADNYTQHRDNPGLLFLNPVPDPYAPGLDRRVCFYARHEFQPGPSAVFPAPPTEWPGWRPELIVTYSQVPEPGTLMLLASGLAALLACVGRSVLRTCRPER
jgi:hypothetical protein